MTVRPAASAAGGRDAPGDCALELRLPSPRSRCRCRCPGRPSSGRPYARSPPSWTTTCCPGWPPSTRPLLAVVGGSTGAGKSTLVNSLVGRRVDRTRGDPADHPGTGAGAPQLRRPLVHRRPDPARAGPLHRGAASDSRSLQLVVEESMPPGLALLDAPDIDSVVAENRAAGLPAAGRRRSVAVRHLGRPLRRRRAVGLPDRRRPSAARRSRWCWTGCRRGRWRTSRRTSGQMMSERGLGDSVLFAVPETTVDAEGLLPDRGGAADPGLAGRAGRTTGPAGPGWCTRPWTAPSARWSRKAPSWPGRWTSSSRCIAQLRAEVDHSYAEAVRTVAGADRRRHAAPRRGAGPLARVRRAPGSSSGRWSRRSAGCGTGWSRSSAASRRAPATSRWRWSPGWSRCCGTRPMPPRSGPRRPGRPTPPGGSWWRDSRGPVAAPRRTFPRAAERAIRDWQGGGAGPGRRRGHGQAVEGPVPGPGGERGRGGADDRGLRAHRRVWSGPRSAWPAARRCWPSGCWRRCSATRPIRRLAETAKEDLDARVQALMSDRAAALPPGAGRAGRRAGAGRAAAAAGGGGAGRPGRRAARGVGRCAGRGQDEAGAAGRRGAAVAGAAAGDPGSSPRGRRRDDIVDAELVDSPRRGVPLMAGRGPGRAAAQRPQRRPGRAPEGADRGGRPV